MYFYTTISTKILQTYADYWFEGIADALKFIEEECHISEDHLIEIDDPLPHCQHDIISPIRIKGRNTGNLEWGKLEKLVGDEWILIEKTQP